MKILLVYFLCGIAYLNIGLIFALLIVLHDRYSEDTTWWGYYWDLRDIIGHAVLWPIMAIYYLCVACYSMLSSSWKMFVEKLDDLHDKETKGDS